MLHGFWELKLHNLLLSIVHCELNRRVNQQLGVFIDDGDLTARFFLWRRFKLILIKFQVQVIVLKLELGLPVSIFIFGQNRVFAVVEELMIWAIYDLRLGCLVEISMLCRAKDRPAYVRLHADIVQLHQLSPDLNLMLSTLLLLKRKMQLLVGLCWDQLRQRDVFLRQLVVSVKQ